ncbi:MAG: DUF4864 domain-containing protein [Bacteroidota bacterium]|nr:DUF4864 domain-containing protein [Bacteroidota bacterium]
MKKFLYLNVVLLIFLVIIFTTSKSLSPPENHGIANGKIKASFGLPQPNPDLGPQEVVEIQVLAMQENDMPFKNYGVLTAFNFASPDYKSKNGPEGKFIQMINNPNYSSLLNFKMYGLDDIYVINNLALQKITLIDANDNPAVYLFKLTRQMEKPFEGCWMIDSVIKF